MAHNLEIVNGVAQMAFANELPWHGLGVKVSDNISPLEMQQAAGLDWTVAKVPLTAQFNGRTIATDKSALIRETDGAYLDTVGNDWNPVQNSTAFEFFNDFVEAGGMKMDTAGSIDNGRMIWALATVNESFELFGGDKVDSHLLFVNPHRYGKTIEVKFTPIRVVCNNTLTMALNKESKNSTTRGHRAVFDTDEVKTAMGIAHHQLQTYKEAAIHLGSKRYTQETFSEYLNKLFHVEDVNKEHRNTKIVRSLLDVQPGAEFAEGSWWQAFNAVTYATDHVLGRSVDSRMKSAWFGPNEKLKGKAMNLALEYADAA